MLSTFSGYRKEIYLVLVCSIAVELLKWVKVSSTPWPVNNANDLLLLCMMSFFKKGPSEKLCDRLTLYS